MADLEVTVGMVAKDLTAGIASLKTLFESFATTMASISSQQVSQTQDATAKIVASYKERIAAVQKELEERKKAIDISAAKIADPATQTQFKTNSYKVAEAEALAATTELNKKITAIESAAIQERAFAAKQAGDRARRDEHLIAAQATALYYDKTISAQQVYFANKLQQEIAYEDKRKAIQNNEALQPADRQAAENALDKTSKAEKLKLEENFQRQLIGIEEKRRIKELNDQQADLRHDKTNSAAKLKIIDLEGQKRIEMAKAVRLIEAVTGKDGQPKLELPNSDLKERTRLIKEWEAANKVAHDKADAAILRTTQLNKDLAQSVMDEKALQAMNQIAMSAAAMGVALTAAFTAAIKPAMELEKSLSAVAAVTGKKMDSAGMIALKNQAIELSGQFTQSAAEIANGMKFLAQAGFDVPQINTMTKDILNLATAADMPLKDAFNIAATTIRSFSLEASEMSRVANVLTKTSNLTNVEVSDLAESFKYAGPVAAAAGLEIEGVSAALGIMGNAGIKASMGGTALRQTISSLIAPTSMQRTMIKELGLTITNASGQFVGFEAIVRQMEGLFATTITDPAQQAGLAMKLFGDRAGPGMLAVINNTAAGLNNLTTELKDATKSADAAVVAAARMDNLADSLLKFKRAGEGLATTAFSDVLTVLKAIVDAGTGVVRFVTNFVKETPGMQTLATVLLSMAGGIGLILTGFSALVLPIVAMGLASRRLAIEGANWTNIWSGGLTNVLLGTKAVKLEVTGLARAFGPLGMLGKLAFTGMATSAKTASTAMGTLLAGIRGATGALWSMQGAMLAIQAATWIGLIITALSLLKPAFDKIKEMWGVIKLEMKDTSVSVEAVTDAYKKLGKAIDDINKSEVKSKALPETLTPPVVPVFDETGKKLTKESWDAIEADAKSILNSIAKIDGWTAGTNKNLDLTNEKYAAMIMLIQAVAGDTVVAMRVRTEAYEANKTQMNEEIANLQREQQNTRSELDRKNIIRNTVPQAEIDRIMKQFNDEINAKKKVIQIIDKALAELEKGIAVVPTRTIPFSDNKYLENQVAKQTEINRVYDESLAIIKQRTEAENFAADRRDTHLTKEEKAANAINRTLENEADLRKDLAERTEAQAKVTLATYKAEKEMYESTAPARMEAIKSYKELGEEAYKAGTQTVATGNEQENRFAEIRRQAVAVGAAYKTTYEKIATGISSNLAAQRTAYKTTFDTIKRLVEERYTLEENRIQNLRKLKNADHTETMRENIAEMKAQELRASMKYNLAVLSGDKEAEAKALVELAQIQFDLSLAAKGIVKDIVAGLTEAEKIHLKAGSGPIADYLKGLDDKTKEEDKYYNYNEGKKKDLNDLIKLGNDWGESYSRNSQIIIDANKTLTASMGETLSETGFKIKTLETELEGVNKKLNEINIGLKDTGREHIDANANFGVFAKPEQAAKIFKSGFERELGSLGGLEVAGPKEYVATFSQIGIDAAIALKTSYEKELGTLEGLELAGPKELVIQFKQIGTDAGTAVVDEVKAKLEDLPGYFGTAAKDAGTAMRDHLMAASHETSTAVTNELQKMYGGMAPSDIELNEFKTMMSRFADGFITTFGDPVKNALSSISEWWNKLFKSPGSPGINLPTMDIPTKKAAGGFIPGFGGGDIVPAMLEPGEFVIRKDAVSSFGASFFAALNNMASPGMPSSLGKITGTPRLAFAAGGFVGQGAGSLGHYTLDLNLGGKRYPVTGEKNVIEGLINSLKKERAMVTG